VGTEDGGSSGNVYFHARVCGTAVTAGVLYGLLSISVVTFCCVLLSRHYSSVYRAAPSTGSPQWHFYARGGSGARHLFFLPLRHLLVLTSDIEGTHDTRTRRADKHMASEANGSRE